MLYWRDGETTDEQTILEIEPRKYLRHNFNPQFSEFAAEPPSRVTFSLLENNGVVRLEMVHDKFPEGSAVYQACKDAWPMILSSLKTLLETGQALSACEFNQ